MSPYIHILSDPEPSGFLLPGVKYLTYLVPSGTRRQYDGTITKLGLGAHENKNYLVGARPWDSDVQTGAILSLG